MGNNKEESARREGMAYALRIAKEKGIEALEKELEFRNITNIPIKIWLEQEEVSRQSEEYEKIMGGNNNV